MGLERSKFRGATYSPHVIDTEQNGPDMSKMLNMSKMSNMLNMSNMSNKSLAFILGLGI